MENGDSGLTKLGARACNSKKNVSLFSPTDELGILKKKIIIEKIA